MKYDLIIVWLGFLFCMGSIFPPLYGQKEVEVVKIIDTLALRGVMVYEYNSYPMYFTEDTKETHAFKSYRSFLQAYRKSSYKILSSFTFGSGSIKDSPDFAIKMDSCKCLEYKDARLEHSGIFIHRKFSAADLPLTESVLGIEATIIISVTCRHSQ